MFFYVAMVPVLVASLFMIRKLRSMSRHDRVLYMLCGLRREMMGLMRERTTTFSREEYFALRELVALTNEMIHDYNAFKSSEFSIGKRIEYGADVKRLDNEIKRRDIENETISELYDRFAWTMFVAVLTFIPWPKLALKVLPIVLLIITKIGIDYLTKGLRRWIDFLSWLNQKSQQYAYRF